MLNNLGQIQGAMNGVGFMLGTQKPFVSFLVKNWPLAVIAGFAMYGKINERTKKGDLTVYNGLADLGLVLSPLVGLALLNQMAQQEHAARAGTAPLLPAPGAPS